MKPETESNKFSTSPAVIVISALLVVVAIALWWTITVLAVVLITVAVVLIIPTLCSGMLIPQDKVSVKRTKRDKSSGIDIERILKFETGVFQAREKKQAEPDRSITAREFLSELDLRIPLDVLDGIDEKMKKRMRKSRIEDVSSLAKADAKQMSTRSDLEIKLCQILIADAKGIVKGAGISSIFDLAMSDADEVLTKVTRAVNTKVFDVPDNHNFTLTKILGWIDRANNIISAFDVDEIQKLIEKQDK